MKLYGFIKQKNKSLLSAFVVLYSIALILLLLSNYNYVWTQPEEFNWREYILADGTEIRLHDLYKIFDWQTFEYEARTTRPLSSMAEIIDTKFRVWLWKYIIPHPSLSITWVLLLLISPLVFYKVLRNIGIEKTLSIVISCLYVTNPATLSLAVVNFRPSKPVANFAILLCLYIASSINKRTIDPRSTNRRLINPLNNYYILCVVMLISFFFDETALISYVAVPLFFPKVVFVNVKRIMAFIIIPIITCCCIYKLFPFLGKLAGYSGNSIASITEHHTIINNSTGSIIDKVGGLFTTGWRLVTADIFTNVKIFLSDSFGLVNPSLSPSYLYKFLWAATVLLLALIAMSIGIKFFRYIRNSRINFKSNHYTIGSASVVALVLVTVFANLLLHLVDNHIWGLHWLSTFWAIFYFISVAIILNKINLNYLLMFIASIFIISTSYYNFLYVNNSFKKFFYYRTIDIKDIWTHRVNRFQVAIDKNTENYKLTKYIWKEHNNISIIQHIPTELYYLVHDLRLVTPGKSYAQRWSVFDGHVNTFSLIRSSCTGNNYFTVLPER
jgi:hypothetical protein